jgi:hypothetical protein
MFMKRLALVVISLLFGMIVTWLIVTVDVQVGPFHIVILGTTLDNYGLWYILFTALSLACALGVWLDKWMGTQILPK